MTHPLKGRAQSSEHIANRVAAWHKSAAPAKARERFRLASIARMGVPQTEASKLKKSLALRGRKNALGCQRSPEFKKHLSDYWTDNPKHNHWVDGKGFQRSTDRIQAMSRLPYRLWRTAVFTRDNYTCVTCHKRGGDLVADHKLPYATHPEVRYDVGNGQTLCQACHLKTPTYGNRALKISRCTNRSF